MRLALFGLALWVLLVFIQTFHFVPGRYQFAEGEVSNSTIKAPQKVVYTSQIRMREERARAAAAVSEIHVFDAAVVEAQRQKLSDALRQIGEIRRTVSSFDARRESIRQVTNPPLPSAVAEDIAGFTDSDWLAVAADAPRVMEILTRGRITERQLEDVRNALPAYVSSMLSERQAGAVHALVAPLLRANFILDPEATERARREAQDRVQPVRITIEKGETVLRDGDVVRALDLERLDATGLRNPTIDWRSISATALLVGLLCIAQCLYLHRFRPQIADHWRQLVLLGMIIVVSTLAIKLILPGRDLWGYAVPIGAPIMLVAVLLGADLAIIVNLVIAASFGLIASNSFEMATIAMIGGLAGTMVVSRFERLNTFFVAGFVIAFATFLGATSFALLNADVDLRGLALLAGISMMNGMLAAALTLGTLAAIGHLFGITTTLGLLELAHPTQPLFRRLLTEAPGTYHHSIVIANLAERAAEAIGADPLLCRVAAYYHDVGKIIRPYAFIENQIPGENIHDELDPVTSARMIVAHVADGLELARRYRLPDRIRDMIAQHHGDAFAGIFYQRAVQRAGGAAVNPVEFRYPGPKPQTREAGILLLADGVEAATRASRDHSPTVIEQIVRKSIADRLADGQLDDCGLTFRDVDQIRQVFIALLRGMFHPRISYPEAPPEAVAAPAVVALPAAVEHT